MKLRLLVLSLAAVVALRAQIVPHAGPYTTPDGGYTINITATEDAVTVVEPNKKSVYTKVGPNEYQFVNPKNDIEYRIEVVSKTELSFFKPATRDNRTKLTFSGTVNEASNASSASSAPTGVNSENYEKYSQIAEKYKEKIKTNPEDTHLWALCAASAMARATLNDQGFEDYARKVVRTMKSLLEDKTKNPCPDVIPAAIWTSVKAD